MVNVLLSFLLKLNSHQPSHNYHSVKKQVETISIEMAFKLFITSNRMLRGHVNLAISLS